MPRHEHQAAVVLHHTVALSNESQVIPDALQGMDQDDDIEGFVFVGQFPGLKDLDVLLDEFTCQAGLSVIRDAGRPFAAAGTQMSAVDAAFVPDIET